MKGKKKKIKKVIKKIVKPKVKAARSVSKRKVAKKKIESFFGARLPVEEGGTRIFVQQEIDEPITEPEIAQEEVDNVLVDSFFPEFDFSEEEFPDEQELIYEETAEPEPELYLIKNKEMSNGAKTVIMYVAVTSIMVVIVFFWFLSVKYSLSQSMQATSDQQTDESLDKIRSSLGGIKDDFFSISDYAKTQIDKGLSPEIQSNNINTQLQIPDDITKQLKEKLQNLNTNSANINN